MMLCLQLVSSLRTWDAGSRLGARDLLRLSFPLPPSLFVSSGRNARSSSTFASVFVTASRIAAGAKKQDDFDEPERRENSIQIRFSRIPSMDVLRSTEASRENFEGASRANSQSGGGMAMSLTCGIIRESGSPHEEGNVDQCPANRRMSDWNCRRWSLRRALHRACQSRQLCRKYL